MKVSTVRCQLGEMESLAYIEKQIPIVPRVLVCNPSSSLQITLSRLWNRLLSSSYRVCGVIVWPVTFEKAKDTERAGSG